MLGVHSSFTEIEIDEFSYKFYKGCIKELGIKFSFDSISNVLGNSYAEKGGEMVNDSNPFNYKEKVNDTQHRMTKEMAFAFMEQKG